MKWKLPKIIEEVGFDFSWDEQKVWKLQYPIEQISIDELTWHFKVPFIWSKPNGYYDVEPQEVLDNPNNHPEEYQRTMEADLSYPIDIMYWKGRWLILDGLHRLMKASLQNDKTVKVRKIPESAIPLIKMDKDA